LAPHRINHPREVVHEGDQVDVCILRIDPDQRRLELRLLLEIEPALEEDDEADEPAKAIAANIENEADDDGDEAVIG
jgi:ribosomal protein S1